MVFRRTSSEREHVQFSQEDEASEGADRESRRPTDQSAESATEIHSTAKNKEPKEGYKENLGAQIKHPRQGYVVFTWIGDGRTVFCRVSANTHNSVYKVHRKQKEKKRKKKTSAKRKSYYCVLMLERYRVALWEVLTPEPATKDRYNLV